MNKSRVKFSLFLIGVSIGAGMVFVAVSLMSQFVAYFQQGADPASIFRGHSLVVPDEDDVRWAMTGDVRGDLPSSAEQEEILAAYWLAWEALARAYVTKDLSDLRTYWSGTAYTQAIAGIMPDHRQALTHADHVLRLTYFSDDGSVVAFDDLPFTLIHEIGGDFITVRVKASVVMTSDQGFWRIRSIILEYG